MTRIEIQKPVLPVVHLSPALAERVVSGALDGVSFDPACPGSKPLSIIRCRPLPLSVVIYATGCGECPGMAVLEAFDADKAGRILNYRFRDARQFTEPYRLTETAPGTTKGTSRGSAPVQVSAEAMRAWSELVGFSDRPAERRAG